MNREEYTKKVALITELNTHNQERSCQLMVTLCDLMIQDLREENDVASSEVVKLNQGNIEAWKAMKSFIVEGARKIPAPSIKK